MNERVISVLRGVREVAQTVAEPVDWAVRLLNNKRGYPPLRLRQQVGDLRDFEGSGGEYLAYLKLLCGLAPGQTLLDMGCGCGLMCLDTSGAGTLFDSLGSYGAYFGFDTNERLIKWCRKRRFHPRAMFYSSVEGIKNAYGFDVVLCKSLFTHLQPHETYEYLTIIYDKMSPGAKCLSTWFLLDDRQKMRGRYTFPDREAHIAFERRAKKGLAVAYELHWLIDILGQLGFKLQFHWGSWRGETLGLSYQDIIVLEKI